jgi:D-sedoheptulose 7-phosphate isomerase
MAGYGPAADGGIAGYYARLRDLLARLPVAEIERALALLLQAYQHGRRIYFLGNGGSAATASHAANDFCKLTISPGKPRVKALALTDNVPLITAWANDAAYSDIFMEQLENLLEPGDVVVAISGSGNSPNVLKAVEFARARGAATIGWTGFQGGRLKDLVDVAIVVPSDSMAQIEDVHLTLNHALAEALRDAIRRM